MDKDQEEVDYPHPDFLKGFNEGYALAKYAPEVGGVFGKYVPESDRGQGFRKGREQYAMQEKDREGEVSKDASDNKRDIQDGKERNRDSLLEDYNDNLPEMGIEKNDRFLDWLSDKEVNKGDMGLDHEIDKDNSDYEPE